jgi:hypothetical protein
LFGETYDSATAVGMRVRKLAPKLLELEGIAYEYGRTGRSRTHTFTREIV